MTKFLTDEDLEELTNAQLTKIYNLGQDLLGRGEDSYARKFRDAKTGVDRVRKLRVSIVEMHKNAQLAENSQGDLSWELTAPSVSSTSAGRKIGTTTLNLGGVLTVLKSNPKRPGTRAWKTYELYEATIAKAELSGSTATGEDFVSTMIENGYSRNLALSTLHWDIDHGYISLVSDSTVRD